MKSFLKPAMMLALAATMCFGAQAQSLRKMTQNLDLTKNQKQQVKQILGSGNRKDAGTRQRMQQQIMNVLTPRQQNQLAYEMRQRANSNNGNGQYYNGTRNNGYNSGYYTNGYNNNGYNNVGVYNNGYNNGYYNNPYNGSVNYNNGNVLPALINSGILNGLLQNLVR